MAKVLNRLICLIILSALLLTVVSGCQSIKPGQAPADSIVVFNSFAEIPGVTAADIAEIEALRNRFDSFTYGMLLSTEAFFKENGEIGGYSAHIAGWLTELFGIPFIPEIVTWQQVSSGLRNGEIDFTGELTPSEERALTYKMTDPIAQRTVKFFRIEGSEPLSEIAKTRLPRFALLEGTVYADNVLIHAAEDFEPVFIPDNINAYELMISGEIDALLSESSAEAVFDVFGDVVSKDYHPLLYAPVSLSTYNHELEPIIRIVQMALDNGGVHYLNSLYDKGHSEYLKHKLRIRLTEEELAFIRDNPRIPFAAEFDNFPVSFYDERNRDGQWQGISFDVLKEIEALTGLEFEVINDEHTNFHVLVQMLEDGRAYILSELVPTTKREEYFIWPEHSFNTEWSVLISRAHYPNININRVYTHRVGLTRGSVHAEFFIQWFPNHQITLYDNQLEALSGLISDDVDLIIASNSFYHYLTNYLELPDYKANFILDNEFRSIFGINKNQTVLRDIVDKAMDLIDTRTISERFRQRSFEYRMVLAQAESDAQRPWLLGTSALFICVLLLLVVLIIRKQSEKQRLDELVKKRTIEVNAANKAKSAFLSVMSHEIRTPMNAIIGIAEIQLQREKLDIDTRAAIERVYMSGDLLLGIINDILDLSKIEAGKLHLVSDKYEVASLISDTAQLNMMRVGSKRILFELDVDENIPTQLFGDELRVKQILNNLLSNAFKYTSEGTIKLSASVEYNADKDNTDKENEVVLKLIVSDTGKGMTQEQISKIYDEYSRFDQETDRITEGTGLGMSITKNLLDIMGGDITVESEPGKGSTFTVLIPQQKINDNVLGKEMVENLRQFRTTSYTQMKRVQITREPMPYAKALIVDDVETNVFVAKGLLTPYGLKIESADSGYAAIDKIKNGKVYDIIFMDHMMPELDGLETVKRMRELGYHKPIVALTANAVAGQAGTFYDNGFDDYISKPIDLRQLNMVLNRIVRDNQPPEVVEAARQAARDEAERREAERKEEASIPANEDNRDGTSILYKNIVGLDIAKGLEQVDDNESAYIQILRSYSATVRAFLPVLEETASFKKIAPLDEAEKKKLNKYNRTVHSIKGTSYHIFAGTISRIAEELENASAAGEIGYIREHNPGFMVNLEMLVNEIDEMLSDYDTENPRPVKEKPDKEVLLKLLDACKRFDMGDLDDAMDEIERYRYDSDDGLVNWLRDAVNNMQMTQIVEKLSEMKFE